jgi:putative transposase
MTSTGNAYASMSTSHCPLNVSYAASTRSLNDRGSHRSYASATTLNNAYIERYNRTARGESFGQYIFETIEALHEQATECLWTYNNEQPNMGIGGITPAMKLKTAA